MTEDFIIEEEGESPSNRRSFLIAVGVLLAILVLSAICSATLLIRRNGGANGDTEQIAAIETQNAMVAIANEAVTQTIIAMETEAALPTNTPAAPPTNTPAPTSTRLPTNTPVVRQAEEDGDATATTESAGVVSDNTPTPISASDASGGGDDALPQTGIETWGALVAAFLLVAVLVTARRLRGS